MAALLNMTMTLSIIVCCMITMTTASEDGERTALVPLDYLCALIFQLINMAFGCPDDELPLSLLCAVSDFAKSVVCPVFS